MQHSIRSFFSARATPPPAVLPYSASSSIADADGDAASAVKRGYPACTVEAACTLAAPSSAATTSQSDVPAAAALGSARVEGAMDMVSRIWLKYSADHKDTPTIKKHRTHAVQVKGQHSSIPGLQDLIAMGYHTFGGFWNMPRPWENPHCKVHKCCNHVYILHRSLTWLL
jgi:hypothetical protein